METRAKVPTRLRLYIKPRATCLPRPRDRPVVKFAGSGGSIIGMYRGDDMLARLIEAFDKIQAKVIKPIVAEQDSPL